MKEKLQKTSKSGDSELRRQRRRARMKDFGASLCFLSPSLLGVGVFFIVPFFVVVYYSLIDGVGSRNFVFLDNYIKLFQNSAFQTASKNTLQFSFIAVPLAVVLPILLALMLEAKIPMKSQFRTFFLSPMMVPVASVVLIWQVVFHRSGVLSNFVTALGGTAVCHT